MTYRAVVYIGVSMDSILDGSVEDILGLFSCQVHPWIESRSGVYNICSLLRKVFLVTFCSCTCLQITVKRCMDT